MKIENSDLWVRPFTGIPAAAKFEGTWEWRGKTGEFSLVYHFFRVSRWVNSLMFELPEPIVDLCGGDDEEKQEEKERTMEMTSYMFPGFVMI